MLFWPPYHRSGIKGVVLGAQRHRIASSADPRDAPINTNYDACLCTMSIEYKYAP
jgi:Tfp pilus assembly protein PilF